MLKYVFLVVLLLALGNLYQAGGKQNKLHNFIQFFVYIVTCILFVSLPSQVGVLDGYEKGASFIFWTGILFAICFFLEVYPFVTKKVNAQNKNLLDVLLAFLSTVPPFIYWLIYSQYIYLLPI